jgi:hypothetical protein
VRDDVAAQQQVLPVGDAVGEVDERLFLKI